MLFAGLFALLSTFFYSFLQLDQEPMLASPDKNVRGKWSGLCILDAKRIHRP
jgi:hypothetical protein